MNQFQINVHLVFSLVLLSITPFLASFYFLDDVVDSALGLSVDNKLDTILLSYQKDLKRLKDLDLEHEEVYRRTFELIKDARVIYNDPKVITSALKKTYVSYFYIGFLSVLLISIIASIWISKRVASSYALLLQKNLKKSQRIQQLRHIEEWQSLVGRLVHEIKNPLTPIELAITSLQSSFSGLSDENLKKKLSDTKEMIVSEVNGLKKMLTHFSEFSKLPPAELSPVYIYTFMGKFIDQYHSCWETLTLSLCVDGLMVERLQSVQVLLDKALFKQCLINLLNNASQVNNGIETQVEISMQLSGGILNIFIKNNGVRIFSDEHEKIFQVGYSSKTAQGNVGLGLPIVQKIILEHEGDISCMDLSEGAGFQICLPIVSRA